MALPGVVGLDDLRRAVGVRDAQLRDQAEVRAVVVEAEGRDLALPPAVAELGAEGVRAAADLVGDVVRPVLDALAVLGPAGREELVADLRAVELQLVDPLGRGVDPRRLDRLARLGRERRAQQRLVVVQRAVEDVPAVGDTQAVCGQGAAVERVAPREVGVQQDVTVLAGDRDGLDVGGLVDVAGRDEVLAEADEPLAERGVGALVDLGAVEIGRASCRERVSSVV